MSMEWEFFATFAPLIYWKLKCLSTYCDYTF